MKKVCVNYHIQFSAYANDNPKQSLKAELYFPDASISPFTLIKPDPFKDKKKKMSQWLIGEIELSDDPSWRKSKNELFRNTQEIWIL